MNKRHSIPATSLMAFLVALVVPVSVSAQGQISHKYRLVVMGTLGGPQSYTGGGIQAWVNDRGEDTGLADTALQDPFAPYCIVADCFVGHTFVWQNGVLTDLGGLPGGNTSGPSAINSQGWVAGLAENGLFDRQVMFPVYHAVVWENRRIVDLGTFGGNFSYADDINNDGQVVGFAANATPDSFNVFGNFCFAGPIPTQLLAFIWQGGVIRDLGTLGGPDSCALFINQPGQVAGQSYTNFTPNPTTGFPTVDPFLWQKGRGMVDLGSLGGTLGLASAINNRGEVVGQSDLTGDVYSHPFRWSRGSLTDLGTLGGNSGYSGTINDAGEVTGAANLPGDQTHHAFLWRPRGAKGVMKDLGTVDGDPCSLGNVINSSDQIVGSSTDCHMAVHAFLWENGRMVDLNAFVPPSAGIALTEAFYISSRGWIVGSAVLTNGDAREFLLIPCARNAAGCLEASGRATARPHNHLKPRILRSYQFPGSPRGLMQRPFGQRPNLGS